MADTVGIGILDTLAETVGAGVNAFALERVPLQHERIAAVIEPRIGTKVIPGDLPQPFFETVEIVAAANTHLLDHFLVEVVQQLLPRFLALVADLRFEVYLKLVELEGNLFRRAALLVNGDDALLEVHTGLDGAQHLVACAEHAVEQAELLIQKLVNTHIGGVATVEEIDDDHVEFLAVAVAAAN